MMASYSKRLKEFVTMVEYLSLENVEKRLLRYLNKHKTMENKQYVVRMNLNKKELSFLLGTIPETLSRNL